MFISSFQNIYRSLLRFILIPLVKYEIEFEDNFDNKNLRNIVFVLPSESNSDLLSLERFTKTTYKISPLDRYEETNLRRSICIRKPKYSFNRNKVVRKKSKQMGDFIKLDDKLIELVLVSFFWGKHPDKQVSLFKILFSQSWSSTNSLKKIFKIIFHGRSLYIKFHQPIKLKEIISKRKSNEENYKTLNRFLRSRFRKEKKAVLGPDISHRRTSVRSLIRNSFVRDIVEKESGGNLKKKKRLKKKARQYAKEICSDLSYPVIRILYLGFKWFWQKRYEKLEIRGLEKIKKASIDNSLIYVPCHRSHIDYIALSYLLMDKGLMVPQVAAGNNLNIPIVGSVLRRAGALFIRRSFLQNKLYSEIFFQHLKNLMIRGNSVEFFIEGGRSRTGLSLVPKLGLLSMVVHSFSSTKTVGVKVVPVYVGYEKLLESKSYIAELSGKEKIKESIIDPIKVFRDFRNHLGSAYISFSTPIDLENFLKDDLNKGDYLIDSNKEKPDWLKEATSSLAYKIMESINANSVVTSSSLFALSILSDSNRALNMKDLCRRISLFSNLIKQNPNYLAWIVTSNPKEVVKKTVKLRLIKEESHNEEMIFRPNKEEIAMLTFYQNNIIQFVIIYAVICYLIEKFKSLNLEKLEEAMKKEFKSIKEKLFLNQDLDKLDLSQYANILLTENIINKTKEGELMSPKEDSTKHYYFKAISNIARPYRHRI